MNVRLYLTVAVMTLMMGGPGAAETYPTRPITIIVPAPPGGGMDLLARTIETRLSTDLKQSFVIENKPGANGEIGARQLANSLPNGYTLLLTNPFVDSSSGFDYATDLLPVVPVSKLPIAIGVNPKLGVRSLEELIALAKAKPGSLSYASPGADSPQHILGKMVAQLAGIEWVHVPFRGSGDAITSVTGNHVPAGILGYAAYLPFVAEKQVQLLAIAEEHRLSIAPDLPTISETLPGLVQSAWFAILAPRGTPDTIVMRIKEAVERAKADKEVTARLARAGFVPFHIEQGTIVDFMNKQTELRQKLRSNPASR
jgi:tripartite-type tricarboxylate transporter receptor subunit TctC